jgi:ketol-acid reductoisomerase
VVSISVGCGQCSQWQKIVEFLNEGKMLCFSHGFSITFKELTGVMPLPHLDVALVAPKGSGRSVRANFLDGSGINASFAVYQNATAAPTSVPLH